MPTSKTRPAAAAAKKATAKKASTPAAKQYGLGRREVLMDLELPSGSICLARRPGVQGFIAAGVLDSFDSLTGLVQTEHVAKKSARPQRVSQAQIAAAAASFSADADKMKTGFQLIDRLVCHTVAQPETWIDYQMKDETDDAWAERQADHEENHPDAMGISEVVIEDKFFIMQWAVGGSADLEKFRKELPAGLADLAAS